MKQKQYMILTLLLGMFISCTTTHIPTTIHTPIASPTLSDIVIVIDGTPDRPSPTLTSRPPLDLPGATPVATDLVWPMFNEKFSPDGETLVGFKSVLGYGYGDLFAIDLTTWETRTITSGAGTTGMNHLFWSPDGHTIGFQTYNSPYPHEIWLVDVDSGEKQFFAEGSIATWSPDGQRIAIATLEEESIVLRILNVDGKESEEVFRREGWLNWEAGLAWSPNGQYIAFSWGESVDTMLHTLDLETLDVRPFVMRPSDLRILGWTADGEWLAVDITGGIGETGFVSRDGTCWSRPKELEGMRWTAFSGRGAKAFALYGSIYIIDLYEAFGPDFPRGVLGCR